MESKSAVTKKTLAIMGLLFVGSMASKIEMIRNLQEVTQGTTQEVTQQITSNDILNIGVQEPVTTQITKPEGVVKPKKEGFKVKKEKIDIASDGESDLSQEKTQIKGKAKGLQADFVPKGQIKKQEKKKQGLKKGLGKRP